MTILILARAAIVTPLYTMITGMIQFLLVSRFYCFLRSDQCSRGQKKDGNLYPIRSNLLLKWWSKWSQTLRGVVDATTMSTSLQLERDQIQKQIAQLQQALDSLSAGGITASTSRSSSLPASQTPAILSKRQRRAQSAQIGPLPPILAAQPKRHIALLFS